MGSDLHFNPPREPDARPILQWLEVILDQVDYTAGACNPTEMVGACLNKDVIASAKAAIANYRKDLP